MTRLCVLAWCILGVAVGGTCPAPGMTFTEARLDPTDSTFHAWLRNEKPRCGWQPVFSSGRDGLFYLPVQPTSVECALMGHGDLETQSSVWEKAV